MNNVFNETKMDIESWPGNWGLEILDMGNIPFLRLHTKDRQNRGLEQRFPEIPTSTPPFFQDTGLSRIKTTHASIPCSYLWLLAEQWG